MSIGFVVGYTVAYSIFTISSYFMLKWLGRLPQGVSPLLFVGITFMVTVCGKMLKRVLK